MAVVWPGGYSSGGPLAWEPPYATVRALKRQKTRKKKKKEREDVTSHPPLRPLLLDEKDRGVVLRKFQGKDTGTD